MKKKRMRGVGEEDKEDKEREEVGEERGQRMLASEAQVCYMFCFYFQLLRGDDDSLIN